VSEDRVPVVTRVSELRDAFDHSFAEPLPPGPPLLVDLLAIRVGAEPYALRLGEVAGLYADRKITPVPGGTPALLGIAGFRGVIVPVYDLQLLLGDPAVETVRWLAMAAEETVAFAFAAQEGQLRVAPETIVLQQSDDPSRPHVREFVRLADSVCPVIDLSSVLEAVRRQMPTNLNPGGS
jgi:chemotaxis signal transduction protein